MSFQQINLTKLSLTDLMDIYTHSGYNIQPGEFDFAKNTEAVKYIGFNQDKHHVYLVGFYDDHEDEFMACQMFVGISKNGTIELEFGGMPLKSAEDEQEVLDFIYNYPKIDSK